MYHNESQWRRRDVRAGEAPITRDHDSPLATGKLPEHLIALAAMLRLADPQDVVSHIPQAQGETLGDALIEKPSHPVTTTSSSATMSAA